MDRKIIAQINLVEITQRIENQWPADQLGNPTQMGMVT